ncbi:hypothetical protein GCM10027589_21230 [Actinocorallia lasiicapitis]
MITFPGTYVLAAISLAGCLSVGWVLGWGAALLAALLALFVAAGSLCAARFIPDSPHSVLIGPMLSLIAGAATLLADATFWDFALVALTLALWIVAGIG